MNGDVARRLAPRVVSTPELLRLEEISRDHGFNENLDPIWLAVVISDDGNHVLTPALTHPRTRPDDGPHLRSLLRIQLRSDLPWTDAPAMHSLLDLPLEPLATFAAQWQRAHGRPARQLPLRVPGPTFAAYRRGLHTVPGPGFGTRTFADFLAHYG